MGNKSNTSEPLIGREVESKMLPNFHFTKTALSKGLLLGFVTSIPYFAFWWPYGPFGVFFNILIGGLLGFINGILFSILLNNLLDRDNYRFHFFTAAFLVTLLVSDVLYGIAFVLASVELTRALIFALFPSSINAVIAGYILQRAARRYKKRKRKA